MISNNHNEAITPPSVGLPVLLHTSAERADGRVVGHKVGGGTHLIQPVDVPVRIVPSAALQELVKSKYSEKARERERALRRFETSCGHIPELWRDVLLMVLSAKQRMKEGKREEAQKIVEDHLQDTADFERLARPNLADWLARMLSDGLRKPGGAVEFVVWWNDKAGSLAAGLLCPDARTAAYALLLRGVGQPGGLGICAKCGNPFPATRAVQRYCSHSCQTAAAMRRYRARLKSRAP